jgi:hypothetical protein
VKDKNEVPPTGREATSNYLLEQLLGPTQYSKYAGKPLPASSEDKKIHLVKAEVDSVFHDPETGFPVLQNTRPEMVFGTGVLHSPWESEDKIVQVQTENEIQLSGLNEPFEVPVVPDLNLKLVDDADEEVSSIDQSQRIRPSAMGFTSQIIPELNSILTFTISAATYSDIPVQIEELGPRKWFRRTLHSEIIKLDWMSLQDQPNKLIKFEIPGALNDFAELQIRWRNTKTLNFNGESLIALTSVVSHKGAVREDLFQFELSLKIDNGKFSTPDKIKTIERVEQEDREIEFLYRHVESYATGHGTSVTWNEDSEGYVDEIKSQSVPIFHQEMVSTDIKALTLKMMSLHDDPSGKLRSNLQDLVTGYSSWIDEELLELSSLPEHQKTIANGLATKTQFIASRMQRGVDLLFAPGNELVLEAFRLTNKAMYLQQKHGKIPRRTFQDKKGQKVVFEEIRYPNDDEYGSWRPFQIGFLLMVIPGLVDPDDEDRELVDLIFFPTGGGKTEAYLGAAAMTILHRRLQEPTHSGVDVLMRYTLRLLTVQQFERSSGLIVALEYLRRQSPETLGTNPISIGVWLGDKTTPNKRAKAIKILEGNGEKEDSVEPFVLNKCPWCGAAFAMRQSNKSWIGYKKSISAPQTLKFICGDENCDFSRESKALPIWITDEDVYDYRPSFILGTVDKFAQIAWEEKSRALFNIDGNGRQTGLPPGLIIQDELHLISGPLGSMVGLYETVIEELCSYSKGGKIYRPKIIASTATTRRYEKQILNLYGRSKVTLFPQAIRRSNETYFSRVKRDEKGNALKGTAYMGINPATYATGQLAASQVSAFLSQAPNAWTGDEKSIDYYATSMWFFNSLKELGQTLTLMQSTVVSLLNQMWQDRRLPGQKTRYLEPIMELTGRVSSAQVSKALSDLGIPANKKGSIRTCLASSIMEVGVDVQRLGLLTIMSQPKLTAQYIQVSGRVGRAGNAGPGLVIMLYNSNRARDRSVYENFGPFHRKLYAQVEPLSVTPFAIQTMEKGLWGAIIALYRMRISSGQTPTVLDENVFDEAVKVFRERITLINSSNAKIEDFENQVSELRKRWKLYQPTNWVYERRQEEGSDENLSTALLRRKAEPLIQIPGDSSILIPQSMRNVDGQTDIFPAANVYSFLSQDGA